MFNAGETIKLTGAGSYATSSCVPGMQSKDFGHIGLDFSLNNDVAMMGTLEECIAACTGECKAFSWLMAADPLAPNSPCYLKSTSDRAKTGGPGQYWTTYITACPPGTAGTKIPLGPEALSWAVGFKHDDHVHPLGLTMQGESIVFHVPNSGHGFEGNTALTFTLTATSPDSGITELTTMLLKPTMVKQAIHSTPEGLVVYVDGHSFLTPFEMDTSPGFVHEVEVAGCQRYLQHTTTSATGPLDLATGMLLVTSNPAVVQLEVVVDGRGCTAEDLPRSLPPSSRPSSAQTLTSATTLPNPASLSSRQRSASTPPGSRTSASRQTARSGTSFLSRWRRARRARRRCRP